jgi:hypothetical protein
MQRRAFLLILLENFSDYAVYFRRSLFVDITFVDLICVRGCTPSAVYLAVGDFSLSSMSFWCLTSVWAAKMVACSLWQRAPSTKLCRIVGENEMQGIEKGTTLVSLFGYLGICCHPWETNCVDISSSPGTLCPKCLSRWSVECTRFPPVTDHLTISPLRDFQQQRYDVVLAICQACAYINLVCSMLFENQNSPDTNA